MENKRKKIDIVSFVLIIILLIVLFCYAQLKIFNKDYINLCGYTVFRVITGSMSGTIEINDIVIVKITKDVNKNDIITYKSGENFITHRVIEKNNEKLVTKGDANNIEDIPIDLQSVVGKVVFVFHNVTIWIKVFCTPQVIITLIVAIIFIKVLFYKKDKK